MRITVEHSGDRKRVTVSSSKAGVATVVSKPRKRIEIQLFRNGLSAYEIALRNGYTGTESEYAAESIHPIIDFAAHYLLAKS